MKRMFKKSVARIILYGVLLSCVMGMTVYFNAWEMDCDNGYYPYPLIGISSNLYGLNLVPTIKTNSD